MRTPSWDPACHTEGIPSISFTCFLVPPPTAEQIALTCLSEPHLAFWSKQSCSTAQQPITTSLFFTTASNPHPSWREHMEIWGFSHRLCTPPPCRKVTLHYSTIVSLGLCLENHSSLPNDFSSKKFYRWTESGRHLQNLCWQGRSSPLRLADKRSISEHTYFRCACYQPPHHFPPSPIQCWQRHPHHLLKQHKQNTN